MANRYLLPKKLFPILITLTDGRVLPVSSLFSSFNIYENLFNNFISGNMVLVDTPETSLIQQGLTGHGEEISFSFAGVKENGDAENEIKIKMYIYRISVGTLSSGSQGQPITVFFSSKEFLKHETNSIQEKFEGKITDIIRIIAKRLNIEKLEIEESEQYIKRVFNYWNPFKIINSLSRQCGKGYNYNYIFYQTLDEIYKLISIGTLFNKPSKFGTNSLNGFVVLMGFTSEETSKYSCLHHIASTSSTPTNLHHGMIVSNVLTVDLLDKEYTQTYMNLADDWKKQSHLSKNPLVDFNSDYIKNISDSPSITTTRYKSRYLFDCKETKENDLTKDGNDQVGGPRDWLLKRTSQIEQLNQTSVVFITAGNSEIRAGDVLFFGRPHQQYLSKKKKEKDWKYNGKYLCVSVKHTISLGGNGLNYLTTVKAIKDSKGDE